MGVVRSGTVAVVGVGGAGVNAVCHLGDAGSRGARLIAADTSAQTLARAGCAERVLLGERGLGTGGDAAAGAAAAARSESRLADALAGADFVFVAAGLAGGTGGGAAPTVARVARRLGAVGVGFGICPFAFEAERRHEASREARRALEAACDTTIVLDSARAATLTGHAVTLDVALRVADDVLRQAVAGIGELIGGRGWIDVDPAQVREVLADAGYGCLALGVGRGEMPAHAAVHGALASPLADMAALARARAVLVQVTGGEDLRVGDVADAVDGLRAKLAPGCRLVVGVGHDPLLVGAAQATVLATGLAGEVAVAAPARYRPPRRRLSEIILAAASPAPMPAVAPMRRAV